MTAQYPFTLNRTGSRRHRIALIDGPNMSSLGARSKQVYGTIRSLDDLKAFVTSAGLDIGVEVETFSSNHMGDILEYIHGSADRVDGYRSEEHTSELQSLMRLSYAVFCLKITKQKNHNQYLHKHQLTTIPYNI